MKPKGFIPIAIVIVISVIAISMAGVGMYYKMKKDAEPVVTTQVNTNSTVNVNSTVNGNANVIVNTNSAANANTAVNSNSNSNTNTVTDETAGWETYTNADFGYSLRYPSDWPIEKENSTSKSAVTIGNIPADSPRNIRRTPWCCRRCRKLYLQPR